MKGNKSMILLGVLALLVGIYLVVRFTDNGSRSESFKSELVTFNTEEVTKVQIYAPQDTTKLEKDVDSWMINGKYKADEASVISMLNTLKGIKPSRLASRSEDTWKDFQVDNSGTRVVAYENGSKVLDIVLGRFNVEGQRSFYSYVRLFDESDVYVAKDFMKMSVSTGAGAYRNDDILRVNKDSLIAIQFNYPDSAFALTKTMNQWSIDGVAADSAAIADYISGLRFVNSRNFSDNSNSPKLFDVTYQFDGGKSATLSAYVGGGLSSDQNEAEYWIDPTINEKVFKGKTYFVGQ